MKFLILTKFGKNRQITESLQIGKMTKVLLIIAIYSGKKIIKLFLLEVLEVKYDFRSIYRNIFLYIL